MSAESSVYCCQMRRECHEARKWNRQRFDCFQSVASARPIAVLRSSPLAVAGYSNKE
jgi:hypothetical protein